jgi:MFS family permease
VRQAWRSARALPGWLQALLVGQFVSAAGSLAWIYLTLYLVSGRHLTSGRAGALAALYGVGLIAGNLLGGGVGDRIGLRRALLGSLFGWAATCVLVPISAVPVLAPLLVIAGLATGASRPLMSAVVLQALPPERRREGAALSRVVFNAGTVIGPPLGALAAGRHFAVIFVVDAVTSLVLAGVIWRRVPRDSAPHPGFGHQVSYIRPRDQNRMTLTGALRASPLVVAVLLTVVATDTAYRQYYVALPLQLRDLGERPLVYGLLITLNCVVIVLFEVQIALRLAGHRAAAVIAAGYALVGVGWLVIGVHAALATIVAATVIVTAGEMLYKPTATATVADAAPPGRAGTYQSLYAAASISGTVVAPALGGAGYELSPRGLWLVAALVAGLAGAALAWAGARNRVETPA